MKVLFALLALIPNLLLAHDSIDLSKVPSNVQGSLLLFREAKPNSSFQKLLSSRDTKVFTHFEKVNFGYSQDAFWVEVPVENPTAKEIVWFLELETPFLDTIELYSSEQTTNTPLKVAGDSYPFGVRDIAFRNPSFKLVQSPNSKTVYYLKIQSESTISLSIKVYPETNFLDKILKEQILFGFFYGSLFVMMAYNLFLFFSTREKNYFLYVLYLFSFILFQATLNGFSFQYFWPNSIWWTNHSLPFFICLASVTGLLFSFSFLDTWNRSKKFSKFAYIPIFSFASLVALASLALGYSLAIQLSIAVCVFSAIVIFSDGVISFRSGYKPSRYFLLAWSIFLFGVLLYSLKSGGVLPENEFTKWTIQIGSWLEVILLSFALGDKIKSLTNFTSYLSKDLEDARTKIEESEKRFRNLFHSSEDIIFVLDEEWNFVNINRTISKYLGYKPQELQGKNFLTYIYSSKEIDGSLEKIFVLEKLEELQETKQPIKFKSIFHHKYLKEPTELEIKVQVAETDGVLEFLAQGYPVPEDILLGFLEKERVSYTVSNNLQNSELLASRLSNHLKNKLDSGTVMSIKTCLREILVNAIEHGNLEISFEEKSNALATGEYLDLIRKRQLDQQYSNKKVKIDYILAPGKICYRITDEGKGFNWRKQMKTDLDELNEQAVTHGRGISMTRSVFDIVEYNEKGNQVSLIKFI